MDCISTRLWGIIGQRWPITLAMVIGGAACITTLITKEDPTVTLVLSCAGYLGISSSYVLVRLLASKFFPNYANRIRIPTLNKLFGHIVNPIVNQMVRITSNSQRQHFDNFIAELNSSGKLEYVISEFNKMKKYSDVEGMFHLIWGLEEAHRCLDMEIIFSSKSKEDSEKLRKEGENCYDKKQYEKALKYYNLSLMSAPHPEMYTDCLQNKLENADSRIVYKELALAFVSRSIILYDLKQYRQCIYDIDTALKLGYYNVNNCDILERKMKCLFALNEIQEGRDVLEECINYLKFCNLSHSEYETKKISLLKYKHRSSEYGKYSRSRENKFHTYGNIRNISEEDLVFAYQTPPPPSLKGFENPSIPALSNALRLQYTPQQGRFLVATRDIHPGEVLAVERGYVTSVNVKDPMALKTYCCTCLARCAAPLPCPECTMVVFCSENCRMEGLTTFHRIECEVLATISVLKFPCLPAYRMLIKNSYVKLKNLIPKLQEEAKLKHRKTHGFNDDSVYNSTDYRTMYHLEGNVDKRKGIHLIELCCMAFMLLKLLVKSKRYFIDKTGRSFKPLEEDIILFGSTLLTHLTRVACNSCELIELQMNVEDKTSTTKHVGSGIFSATSLFNHSCNPSAMGFSNGCQNVINAVRFIRAGMEVKVTYGKLYYIDDIAERRAVLLKDYFFTCNCKACAKDWHLNNFIPQLKPSRSRITKIAIDYTEMQQDNDKENLQEQLDIIIDKYNSAKNELELYKVDKGKHVQIMIDLIDFFDKYVELPNDMYIIAQVGLADYLMEKRACNFVRE